MNTLVNPSDMPVAVPGVYCVILNDQQQWVGHIKCVNGKWVVSFCGIAGDDCVSKIFDGLHNARYAARFGSREDFLTF